ncbi:MAG: hypothetical protein KUG78_09005 [Kangiellaceae bacterium]|nr:hypothetical protein [Kangiellaceae bacterium]
MVSRRLIILTTVIVFCSFSGVATASTAIIDPTRPAPGNRPILVKKQQEATKERALTAIFYKQGKGTAIINGNLYQAGDYFAGNRIISIESNKVLLKNADGYSRLTLINNFKKLKKN